MRSVCVLGASGSVGSQALEILREDPARFCLRAFSVGHQVGKIPAILASFPSVQSVCVLEEEDAKRLSSAYPSLRLYHGDDGLLAMIRESGCEMIVNAVVGFAGLAPSLEALRQSKILCLANKESLVVGNPLLERALQESRGRIYPIDSEHVALAKLLSCVKREDVEGLYITGSGGAFRDLPRENLSSVTPEMALQHPNWQMGKRITVDCATMMNKGFEVLEAKALFHFPLEKIHVVLHRESCVHSLIRLHDGAYFADISTPSMKGPIAYALYEGQLPFTPVQAQALEEYAPYHFSAFDPSRYPAVGIALSAERKGGTSLAVLNAADEEAVGLFLEGKIPFLRIETLVQQALDSLPSLPHPSYEELQEADAAARRFVRNAAKGDR